MPRIQGRRSDETDIERDAIGPARVDDAGDNHIAPAIAGFSSRVLVSLAALPRLAYFPRVDRDMLGSTSHGGEEMPSAAVLHIVSSAVHGSDPDEWMYIPTRARRWTLAGS